NAGHHDARALPAHVVLPEQPQEVDGRPLPLLSASASTAQDSALVSLSNLDASEPRTVVLALRRRDVTRHRAQLLTAEDTAAHTRPGLPAAVAPTRLTAWRPHERGLEGELPAHSYATIARDLAGAGAGARPGPV